MNDQIFALRSRIESWLTDYITSTTLTGFVVGVSGGIDSALCAKLGSVAASRAGKTITALSLPISFDGQVDGRDMTGFYNDHGIRSETFDLSAPYDFMVNLLSVTDLVIRSNIRTRLRSTALYTYANAHKLLVLGTLNRVEFSIGYFQKHAAIGDILPLARLSKATIRQLGESYGMPEALTLRKASGCVHGRNAEDEWGVAEEVIDRCTTPEWLSKQADGVDEKTLQKLNVMYEQTKHKRVYPPIFDPRESTDA